MYTIVKSIDFKSLSALVPGLQQSSYLVRNTFETQSVLLFQAVIPANDWANNWQLLQNNSTTYWVRVFLCVLVCVCVCVL